MSARTVAVFLFLIAVWFATPSFACSCVPEPSVPEAVVRAGAVVTGRVVAARLVSRDDEGEGPVEDYVATVKIARVWKGEVSETIEVSTAFTCCRCGYYFRLGGTDLLYLYKTEGRYYVSVCGRSAKLEDSSSDLLELGPPIHEFSAGWTPP